MLRLPHPIGTAEDKALPLEERLWLHLVCGHGEHPDSLPLSDRLAAMSFIHQANHTPETLLDSRRYAIQALVDAYPEHQPAAIMAAIKQLEKDSEND